MITTLSIIVGFAIAVLIYMRLPKFGRIPKGQRLERIQKSPNFREGTFQNLNFTPQMAEDAKIWNIIKDNFTAKNRKPNSKIPAIKTNIKNIPIEKDVLIWFGHSSYFIQIEGKRILVDPVFSGHASPFSFSVKAFNGANVYSVKDIPELDYLVITHDHWDHLDYKTVLELKSKTKHVVTGLGVGAHFERWNFDPNSINEMDWNEKREFDDGFIFYALPARHFSGRGFRPKRTLWVSFMLQTSKLKIYIGGDSGYDSHFAEIGAKFGKTDLALLENGQFNKAWKYIHMMPDQVLQAAKDLGATRLFPVHNSKFALANHTWDEPLKAITELNEVTKLNLVTPVIGEIVNLNDKTQTFSQWWENMD